jgi:hypothetical protein
MAALTRRGHSLGAIYKLELDGTIIGRVDGGEPGTNGFWTLHHLHCINADAGLGVQISDSGVMRIDVSVR